MPTPVILHISDAWKDEMMGKVNRAFSRIARVGAFHVSIEVYDREHAFGTQGVVSANVPFRRPPRHVESVKLGVLQLSKKEVKAVLLQLKEEWPGTGYNVIHRNCCHFCEEVCRRFGVGPMPGRLTRLQRLCAAFDNSLPGGRRFPNSVQCLRSSEIGAASKKKLGTHHCNEADRRSPLNEKDVGSDAGNPNSKTLPTVSL